MKNHNEHFAHARALQADINASPGVWLPRRDVLLEWLAAFLVRAGAPSYVLRENEADNLAALDQFLRRQKVPVAV